MVIIISVLNILIFGFGTTIWVLLPEFFGILSYRRNTPKGKRIIFALYVVDVTWNAGGEIGYFQIIPLSQALTQIELKN